GLPGVLLPQRLIAATLLAAARLPSILDCTANRDFSINELSVNVLRHLEEPVQVTLLTESADDPGAYQLRSLLTSMRDVNRSRFSFREIPITQLEALELQQAYPQLVLSNGLLVVYGERADPAKPAADEEKPAEPGAARKSQNYKFIPYRDLFQQDMGSFGRPGPPKFVAEDKLVSEIKILSDKGVKAVVYFTQGHGELDLAGFGAGRDDWTAGQLKEL